MKTYAATFIISLALTALSFGQGLYTGVVGNTQVTATLTFSNDQVTGSYKSKTTGSTYRLEGDNSKPGVASLVEFTFHPQTKKWVATADVYLTKSIKNGIITWSGTMKNYDGRNVQVRFTKSK